VLHRAAYAELGLADWTYDALECAEAELAGLVAGLSPEWVGLSCTMPLKRAALTVASTVGPRAAAAGAANTLLRLPEPAGSADPGREMHDSGPHLHEPGLNVADAGPDFPRSRWHADNTDVTGIVGALAELGVSGRRAVVLGAGGTAQAALVAMAGIGWQRLTVAVRDPTRTGEIRAAAGRVGIELELASFADADLCGYDLVISTLPAGAADRLGSVAWRRGTVLLDAVYHPWPTVLASAVGSAGGTAISGAVMLLHQAAGQVELMTQQPAPVAAMRAALRRAAPHIGI
jgi:shikimate dehydrogenase